MRWFIIVRTPKFFAFLIKLVYFLFFISVNTFYHAGQEQRPAATARHLSPERSRQEREFKIGSIGFSDQGILWASIIAVPVEVQLCKAQLRSGKMFCKEL